MAREARKRQKDSSDPIVLLPEDRMRENAWLGAFVYPSALIWYGWTAGFGVFWLVPVSATQRQRFQIMWAKSNSVRKMQVQSSFCYRKLTHSLCDTR